MKSPNWGKVLLGLLIALFVLWIIEQNAEDYANWYIVLLLLGIILANRAGVVAFGTQISKRLT